MQYQNSSSFVQKIMKFLFELILTNLNILKTI